MEGWILNKWFLVGDTGPSWIFFRGGGYLADNKVSLPYRKEDNERLTIHCPNLKGYLCGDDFFVNVRSFICTTRPRFDRKECYLKRVAGWPPPGGKSDGIVPILPTMGNRLGTIEMIRRLTTKRS